MHPKKFLTLCAVTYGALWLAFSCGRTDDQPQPSPTVPITVATVIQSLPSDSPTPTAAAPSTTTTVPAVDSAHDAMQADVAQWDALDALPADTPCQEWLPLAMNAGWPADPHVLDTLGRAIWKESRCQPIRYGDPGTHNWDVGLLQINQIHRDYVEALFGIPYEEAMSDPWKNLHFGWRLYSEREADGKCGWKPWSLPCN